MIEVRAIPGLKGETWGTHIFNLSDLGHPPTRRSQVSNERPGPPTKGQEMTAA